MSKFCQSFTSNGAFSMRVKHSRAEHKTIHKQNELHSTFKSNQNSFSFQQWDTTTFVQRWNNFEMSIGETVLQNNPIATKIRSLAMIILSVFITVIINVHVVEIVHIYDVILVGNLLHHQSIRSLHPLPSQAQEMIILFSTLQRKWTRWSDCINCQCINDHGSLSCRGRGGGGGPDYCAFTSYEEFVDTAALGVTFFFCGGGCF